MGCLQPSHVWIYGCSAGDDLYDVTLTDGDCRLRVTLDPGLNQQVERRVLRAGSTLGQASFSPTFSDQVPGCPREVR